MITILGPTASGKTALAAYAAFKLKGEVISADSRQVYRGLDIGSGKDYSDYIIEGRKIPYHLIDIIDPSEEYNVFHFSRDFARVHDDISRRGCLPILCGGTGLYIQAVLGGYNLIDVPADKKLRANLATKTKEELISLLTTFGPLHATTDITDRERLIRAIEIKKYFSDKNLDKLRQPAVSSLVFGISVPRDIQKERINTRLIQRLNAGMVDEVKSLIGHGISEARLIALGLEYKWVTLFLQGKISHEEMVSSLRVAIHQFSKRQMTWFRRMERMGFRIHWIDGLSAREEQFNLIMNHMKQDSSSNKH